jgi:transcriptional regulator with XRE-family HTH domain
MTDLRKILALNMKLFRKSLGYSQAKLAEVVNTADNYIALIESGKRFPSVAMLERIAAALKVDTIELFSMKPDKIPEKKALQARILADIDRILATRLDELVQ